MTGGGKKHVEVEGKIFKKKLDLKKWKQRVKLLGRRMAELRAVQAELKREMDERLLELRSDPNPPNPHALQLTGHRLQKEDDLPSIWFVSCAMICLSVCLCVLFLTTMKLLDISAGVLQMDLILLLNIILCVLQSKKLWFVCMQHDSAYLSDRSLLV
ncbi:hypothetical protein GQ457_02G010020 [Hibiscus cannabinus]